MFRKQITSNPESGKWALSGTTFSKSIGYPRLCSQQGDVTYTLNGTYKYFIATVGTADYASSGDRSTTVNFEVDDGSGSVLGSKVAQYGKPQVIEVSVQGISSLTLKTSIADLGCFRNPSVAIWGNARVVG
jgi:NPCBM/NEW2 domain